MSSIQSIDLKEIVEEICKRHNNINAVYLFGSRAYKTNSLRSDMDILVMTTSDLNSAEVNVWLPVRFPIVDLFVYDESSGRADSVANGSRIRFNADKYSNIIEQLDAVLLWNDSNGFNESFEHWEQKTLDDIEFKMSIIPQFEESSCKIINRELEKLSKQGIKTFYAGSSYAEISESIIKMMKTTMTMPTAWQKRADFFNFSKIKLKNEYDFQNLIHLSLRSVFPDIESEPFIIKIDGNEKKADFSLCHNKIVIEAKWIDTTSKKNEVMKTIEGLKSFYCDNPNISSLLFLVLYKNDLVIDEPKVENNFSYKFSEKSVYIKLFKNIYG